jgi:hypothetical protein
VGAGSSSMEVAGSTYVLMSSMGVVAGVFRHHWSIGGCDVLVRSKVGALLFISGMAVRLRVPHNNTVQCNYNISLEMKHIL